MTLTRLGIMVSGLAINLHLTFLELTSFGVSRGLHLPRRRAQLLPLA
jgi:hypothetical protein